MRESVLLLVRAVIQVYVRPAMLSNSTYAKNILGKLSGNAFKSNMDVSSGCAVVVSDESDVTITETTTAAAVEAVAGGGAQVGGGGAGGGGDVMVLDEYKESQQERISALCVGGTIDGCTGSTEHREGLICHVVMSLVFLQARCPGEGDIVPEAALRYRYCICTYTVVLLYAWVVLILALVVWMMMTDHCHHHDHNHCDVIIISITATLQSLPLPLSLLHRIHSHITPHHPLSHYSSYAAALYSSSCHLTPLLLISRFFLPPHATSLPGSWTVSHNPSQPMQAQAQKEKEVEVVKYGVREI
jgi:hypothetical protein